MKIFTSLKAVLLLAFLLNNLWSLGQTGNYFAGFQSGTGNTGSYNTFVGYQTAIASNTGWYNSYYGYQAGYSNRGGSYNTFVGSFTGFDNTTGLSNTFVGWAAGSNNTTANSNSFFGNLAGYQNSIGESNSFFGSAAAYTNTTGSNNCFFGGRAGYNNTTASNNTFIGFSAGEKNSTGTLNTFMGSKTGFANTTGTSNTFLGTLSGTANSTGYRNVFVGTNAGQKNTGGGENTFIGRYAGINNTTGIGNTALGQAAGPSSANLVNCTALGYKSYVTVSNALVLGSIKGVNGAANTIRVGIGTAAPGYLLHVNGIAAKPGGGSWTVASDKRLKHEIQPYQEGLEQIMQIKPVWFRYNGKAGLPTEKKYVGVIAQEMKDIAPHTVDEFVYEDSTGTKEKYLDYDANAVTYMLVNAVKELKMTAEKQNALIEQLRTEIASLKGEETEVSHSSGAKLWQNYPNPYGASTLIKYYIPSDVSSAQLKIINAAGQEVYSKDLVDREEGELEIPGNLLSTGSYIYHLIVNGNVVDNKKMLMVR